MDTISQIGKQISELFASLTPSARIMAALMLGVIVVSLGWILSSQQGNSKSFILGVLSPEQVHRAEKAFGAASLGDYEIDYRRIKVPTAQKAQYLNALADGDAIPAQWGDARQEANKSNIFDPPAMARSRKETAKAQDLEVMLKQMSQIEFAAVTYDESRQGFGQETLKTCSVKIKQHNDKPIETSVLRNIAQMMTKSYAGLKEKDVLVYDLGANKLYQASGDPHSAEENPLLTAQAEWEDYYREQVRNQLSQYGEIEVSVGVEVDPRLQEESEQIEYDATPVTLASTSSRRDTESNKLAPGGRPGAVPNTSNTSQSIATAGTDQTSKVKESQESTSSKAGTVATLTRRAPLQPTSVKVSVGISRSHYRDIWEFQQTLLPGFNESAPKTPPDPDTDLKPIEEQVLAEVRLALETTFPIKAREGEDRKDDVNVYSYTKLPPPEIPEATLAENSLAWLGESWSTLAMLALVLASLGMMFSWVRSQKDDSESEHKFAGGFGLELPERIADELDLSSSGSSTDGELGEDSDGRQKPTFDVTGEDMKDDLSSLIKDNPEAAVNVLKTWIGEAA